LIAAPKVATDFAKANDKFVPSAGAMGKTALNPDGVKALGLAAVARRTARKDLVGLLVAPANPRFATAHETRRPPSSARVVPGLCRQEAKPREASRNTYWFRTE